MDDQRNVSGNRSASPQTSADVQRSYLALFNSIDQGFCTIDVAFDPDDRPTDYRLIEVSPSFARQTGIEHGAGRSMREIAPDKAERWLEIYGRVSLTAEPARFEEQSTSLGRWWSVYAFRIEDQPRGQIGVLFNDITERKRGEDYHSFLLKLSDALRSLADPEKVQAVAADLLGAHLRVNHCHYGEVRGEYVCISYSYADGLPPMIGSFRADDFGKRAMDGYRAGKLQVSVNTATDPVFSAEERQMQRGQHIGAYIAVPLVKEGNWVGTFGVQCVEPREWTPSEIELVQEVAERTWAAVQYARAENALRQSEEKYRTLFDSIDEGFTTLEVLFDEQGRPVDVIHLEMNPAYGKHIGASRELLGKRIRQVFPTIEDLVIERYGRVALTGEPVRFEQHIAMWDHWFDAYAARVGGEGSHVVAVVFTNITERKRREHHAAFLDKLSQALGLLASPEEIVRVTGEALDAHLDVGFVHVVDVELDHGDEPAEARISTVCTWEREGLVKADGSYRAGDYLSGEFLRAARAGEPIVIRDTDTDPRVDAEAFRAIGIRGDVVVPILKDGAWPGIIAVCTPGPRDWRPDEVTLIVEVAHRVFPLIERVRAEEALRASELEIKRARDYAEATLRTSPVPLLVLEKDLRVNTANEAFYQTFQVDPAETKGRLVYELGNGQWNIPRLRELLEHVLLEHTALRGFEVTHDFESIGRRTMLLSARRMGNEPGVPERIVLVVEDITERKQVVEALRQSQTELSDAGRRKDEFLAMLAHELRNPLAPIRTGLELIRLAGDKPGSVERVRAMMERQIGHMVRLIDDLLDVSRITSGKLQLQSEPTPLNTLVNSAIEANRAAIAAKQIELSVDLPPTLCVLDVDPTRFIQVISNLLHNATKFTAPRGSIRVSAHIGGESGGKLTELRLSVIDSGIGIAAELLPHIFELFTQGARGSSVPGLGIGLALARQLVEMHGGQLDARSDGLGTGSEFVIRLPLSAPEKQPRSAEQIAVRPIARRVVVIDDNHDAANATAMLVEALGGECRVAYDGIAGVQEVLAYRPEIVLLDIGMPGLDGYEICSRIRRELGRGVIVVALTGFGQEQDRDNAFRSGFDAHLTKPADPKELARLLSELPVDRRVNAPRKDS